MKSYLVTISVGYHNANIYLKLLLHHIKCTGLLQYMTIHITKDQDLGKTKGKGMKLLIWLISLQGLKQPRPWTCAKALNATDFRDMVQ